MKQFHWLLCVAKNCDWFRKITQLSNLTRAPLFVEWSEGSEAKAELNFEIYKSLIKCFKSQVSFCHQSSPVRLWTLRSILQELKNILVKLVVAVNLEAIWFEFWMKGTFVSAEFFCLLWLVIRKSVRNNVGDKFWLGYSWPGAVVSYT